MKTIPSFDVYRPGGDQPESDREHDMIIILGKIETGVFFFTADMLHDWRQQDLPALTDRYFVIMIVGSLIAAGKRFAVAPSFRLRTKTRDASSTLPGRNKHPAGTLPGDADERS